MVVMVEEVRVMEDGGTWWSRQQLSGDGWWFFNYSIFGCTFSTCLRHIQPVHAGAGSSCRREWCFDG